MKPEDLQEANQLNIKRGLLTRALPFHLKDAQHLAVTIGITSFNAPHFFSREAVIAFVDAELARVERRLRELGVDLVTD